MGGYGSGFQGTRKATVEDGLTLCISALLKKGALVPGRITSGSLMWSTAGREPHATIGYSADMRDPEAATLTLDYRVNAQPTRYTIGFVTTVPRYGGRRWWFLCPLNRTDGGPRRRVAKLHLPPGGRYFGSRQAYGLTYKSSQQNGHNRSLYRFLALKMGTEEATIRRALRPRSKRGDRPR